MDHNNMPGMTMATHTGTPTTILTSILTSTPTNLPAATEMPDMNMNMNMNMNMGPMTMYFTTNYKTSLLFYKLKPNSAGAAVGLWLLIFVIAMIYRSSPIMRAYLEYKYWTPKTKSNTGSISELSDYRDPRNPFTNIQEISITRDIGRFLFRAVEATIGYGLMLVVMTFVLVSLSSPGTCAQL